ncbi:hypothetical protein Tco_0641144 [Tanacetum coccineum]
MALEHNSLSPALQCQDKVSEDNTLGPNPQIVSKSSIVTTADASNKRQQPNTTPSTSTTVVADITHLDIQTTLEPITQAPTINVEENINQAENVMFEEDDFINPFGTPEEGIDFKESFAPVARLEAVRIFCCLCCTEITPCLPDGRLQIHQSPRGIFINQAKYAQEILKKHGITSYDSIGTPMATNPLDANLSGTPVDQMKYRSMVRSLKYLTSSRLDIVHATCYCARYQARPTENHLKELKRIFRYLKNTIHMGLWYPKDTCGDKLISWSSKKQDCTSMSTTEAELNEVLVPRQTTRYDMFNSGRTRGSGK